MPATGPAGHRPTLAELTGEHPDYDPQALSASQAQAIIAAFVAPCCELEQLPIGDALERVLGVEVISPIDVPADDNSAMDGYAVRGADLASAGATRLRVVARALAGHPSTIALGAGEAIRIMTGAVIPAGGDTVVVQEAVEVDGDFISIPPGQRIGQHLRRRGEDLRADEAALPAGKILTPADIGLLASLGIGAVAVRRRLRVAFFSTGNEVRSIGETLAAGQLYDSNRYTIAAMLRRLGAEAIDLGVVRDDPRALEEAMLEASRRADAIISSGGVSVGEADYTRPVLKRLGEVDFWKLAIRPGRPMAFGRIGDACYFGLPGNPVAVMITFYFFARGALLRMMGASEQQLPLVRARALTALRKIPGRTEYLRGSLQLGADGAMEVSGSASQGSGVLRSMSEANCVIVLGERQGNVSAGDPVDCVAFHGLA